jgi:hypothetical protein
MIAAIGLRCGASRAAMQRATAAPRAASQRSASRAAMPRTTAAAMLRTTRALSWRFERPLDPDAPFKVVFSGERHFLAALPLTRAALADDGVALVQAPTESLAAAVADAQVVIPFMERLDAAVLEAGTDVRLVVQFGVGLEGVDRDACRRLGIALSNCPARASGNAAATRATKG